MKCLAFLSLFLVLHLTTSSTANAFELRTGDVVAFLGGTNLVNLQSEGTLESRLTLRYADAKPQFRDFSWEGDTVSEQRTVSERWRKDKFGDLRTQLDSNRVTVAIINYGQSEALDGIERLADFQAAYEDMLSRIGVDGNKRRAILVSPIRFEKADDLLPDLTQKNDVLRQYVNAIRDVAAKHDCVFVDLFTPATQNNGRVTTNGLHLSRLGLETVANQIVNRGLGIGLKVSRLSDTRKQVVAKHQLWMDYWRPPNWKCIYGDDGERNFGKSTDGGLTLREEWNKLPGMIAAAEEQIWKTAATR